MASSRLASRKVVVLAQFLAQIASQFLQAVTKLAADWIRPSVRNARAVTTSPIVLFDSNVPAWLAEDVRPQAVSYGETSDS
jgi:hypothetical protein